MNIKLGDAAEWCKTASKAFHIIQASVVAEVRCGKRSREEREVGAVLYSAADSSGGVLLRRKEAQERSPDEKRLCFGGLGDRSDSCGDLLVAA